MFKKSQRLSQSEFTVFFKTGKKHNFEHLTLITKDNTYLKVGVVVGKKVAKAAIMRNTLKRRIYATLRQEVITYKYQGVFIVITKPSYSSLTRKTADEFLRRSIAQVIKGA